MNALSYHPNIARLIGYTEEPNSLVLPMYFADLFELIHDPSYSYTSKNMLQIAREMACALESLFFFFDIHPPFNHLVTGFFAETSY